MSTTNQSEAAATLDVLAGTIGSRLVRERQALVTQRLGDA